MLGIFVIFVSKVEFNGYTKIDLKKTVHFLKIIFGFEVDDQGLGLGYKLFRAYRDKNFGNGRILDELICYPCFVGSSC